MAKSNKRPTTAQNSRKHKAGPSQKPMATKRITISKKSKKVPPTTVTNSARLMMNDIIANMLVDAFKRLKIVSGHKKVITVDDIESLLNEDPR